MHFCMCARCHIILLDVRMEQWQGMYTFVGMLLAGQAMMVLVPAADSGSSQRITAFAWAFRMCALSASAYIMLVRVALFAAEPVWCAGRCMQRGIASAGSRHFSLACINQATASVKSQRLASDDLTRACVTGKRIRICTIASRYVRIGSSLAHDGNKHMQLRYISLSGWLPWAMLVELTAGSVISLAFLCFTCSRSNTDSSMRSESRVRSAAAQRGANQRDNTATARAFASISFAELSILVCA